MNESTFDTPAISVGQKHAGGHVIRVSPLSPLGVHEDDAECAVITRQMDEDSHCGTKYVTHLIRLKDGAMFHGDYTNDAVKAMVNHNKKIGRYHREDTHGKHPEHPET